MREIKFRAWLQGRMIYITTDDDYFIDGDGRLVKIEQIENGSSYQGFEDHECNLMQYTGLKDKHGTEIFEGDIVQFKSIRDIIERYEVEYTNYGEWAIGMHRLSMRFRSCEVIGNVHEHSHLLEESHNGTK